MTVKPSVIASNSTVTVSWNEWTKSENNGDGPVIGYYVCYKQTGETWESCSNTVTGLSIVFNIDGDNNDGFQQGVEYEFGVAAIRPGSLGSGIISPLTQFIIPCLPPVIVPSNVQVSVVSDSEIEVQWQPISISPDRCNSLSKYTLRYTNDNISHQTKTVLAAETMEVVSSIISDLDPCTAYDVRVAATNSAGDGPFSDVVLIKTDSEVPNAVKNPNLESGNRSITVMWEAPDYEHCQIEHYKLTYQLENQGLCGENEEAFEETKTVTELSHTIDNLEPYSRYIIEISAVTHHQSKEGPITTINATTNEGEPLDGPEDIEGMITINATNEFPGSITINFGSVSCLKRRGEITNYIVQVVDEDGNIIGPEKTSAQHATITGIHPCETVTPHVAACTLVGCGEFATGPDITMNTAAPGNVSVKVQHHQKVKKMNVTWSVPEVVYCPIVLYQIMYRRILLDGCQKESHAYTIKSVNGSTTKYILKDLPPFSTYEVVVSAGVNKSDNDGIIYGFGRAGFNTTKQQAPIAAPENVAYDTINARSFNFTWEEIPCGSRQGSIDRYIYVLKHGNSEPKKGTVEGDLYVVLDNLSPCTTYDFKVRGEGTAGKGPQANIQATTISEVPTKVGNGLIIEDGLTFEWDRPRPLACEIVKYYIEANLTNKDMCHASTTDDALSFEEQDTNIDLSDLEPYSEYVVTISAETDVGIGPAYIQNISTPEQAPLAGPRDLFNTSLSSENATFKWTEIECGSRRGFIRGYKFSIHTTVGEEDILTDDDVTDREYHVTNLKPFTEYIVRVRGFNSIGDSDSKELGFITKESTPTVPRNINILNTDTVSFLIEWSRPEPANGIVISYQLIVVGNEEVLIVYNVSDAERDTLAFSYEVRELTPNTNYTIQAAAFTSVGRGPLSDIIYVLTIPGKPGPVSNFQINNTEEKSVTVSWGKPKNPNGEILKYTLKYRILEKLFEPDADITGEWIDATECKGALNKNCTIEDLEPATKYAIEVYASTEAGDGKHLTKNTTTDTPPVPKQPTLKVVSTTDSTITVELFPLEDFIYISNYVILVEKESSAKRRNAKEKLTHKDSPDKYISASFPRDEVPDLFIIGDGKVHNGYYNAPLSKDNKYFLSFRTDDAIDDESRSGKAIQPGSNDTSIGMILGILFGFIVAVLVLGLVWFLKYKRREKNPPKPMLPMSKLKTESRLPHVPSEDTIADTINSYTKPPLKAKPESSKATRVHRPVKIEHLVAYVKKKRMDKEEGFQNDFESLPNEQIHSWDVAKKSENKTKNRYGNIVAYDHCRVVLEPLPGDPHSDYINACYIDGYKQKVAYIATQGPNIASVDDIWRMAWKERSSIIIMVTNLFEAGKKKCEKYWPEKSQTYGRIDVKITDEEECPQYTIRSFKMTKDDEIREIKQFHFTVWPDMGVPEFANDVLRFIDVVKKNGNFDTGPTIVHCSAGVGRTGTMIAINEMLDMARDEGKINVFNFVNQMRKNRVKMVQTLDQYFFIFDALLEAVVCGQTSTKAADINPFYNSLLTSNTLTKRSYILEQYNALEAMNAVMTEENTAGGRLPANVAKNRFLSRIPIDGSRPYLMTLSSEDSTNYINASFLHGYRGKDMYISTQMPLPNTIADFLCMVYDYKSKLIVMLNDDPSTDQTYGKYWPESGSEQHGPMIIEHVSTENSKAAICRTFQLKNTSRSKEKPREIKQYQYLGWPSSSKIPSSAESVLEFLKLLDREDIPSDAPITVHCKNGMERCGVFCTIHSVLQQLQHEQIVDVFHTIRKFRRSKPNMVSPVSQYEFCFNTVRCYLDAFEIYSNYK
ncbi:receptor-type tyrosine-protein phosphatase mu-like [Antedon mediterranea]|uniref:receptor-type tyrosine-protein phosphatase mu-like n=1 Tax=Antedon mediterranea TaxID=105859 RepID=UPI003AF91B88